MNENTPAVPDFHGAAVIPQPETAGAPRFTKADLIDLAFHLADSRSPHDEGLPWQADEIELDPEQIETVMLARPEEFSGVAPADWHWTACQTLVPLLEDISEQRREDEGGETDAQIFEQQCA